MSSPFVTATVATAITALLLIAVAAWILLRSIPTGDDEEPITAMGAAHMVESEPHRHVGKHRFGAVAKPYRPRTARPLITPEDRTFLEAVAAQPVVDSPDPFAAPTPATPDEWFGVPGDDTRQLDAVQ